MKNLIKSISISKPCQEDWNMMIVSSSGKFCQNCNKNVINFEEKTYNQILEYLSSSEHKICGRFKKEQLKNINQILNQPERSRFKRKFLAMAITGVILASGCKTTHNMHVEHPQPAEFQIISNLSNPDSLDYSIISGKILDEEKEPIPGANLYIKQLDKRKKPIGTISDENGSFNLKIPINTEQKQIIEISYLGYKTSNLNLSEIKNKEIELTIQDSDFIFGEICIERNKK